MFIMFLISPVISLIQSVKGPNLWQKLQSRGAPSWIIKKINDADAPSNNPKQVVVRQRGASFQINSSNISQWKRESRCASTSRKLKIMLKVIYNALCCISHASNKNSN